MFVKYGCIRDDKFYEKVKDAIIYKDLNGKYSTLSEYTGGAEKAEVYYVSDKKQQSQYINMFKEQGLNAVELPTLMDTHFISFLEMKNPNIKFKRIDSALSDAAEEADGDDEKNKAVIDMFKDEIKDDKLKIEVRKLKNKEIPAVILLSEESRRMQEMYRSYGQQFAGMADMFHDEYTLVINTENELIQKLDTLDENTRNLVIDHVYDLAKISHSPLDAEHMSKFIARSNELLSKLY